MNLDWTAQAGLAIGTWRLDSFIRTRNGQTDYIATSEGREAHIALIRSGTPEAETARESWQRAMQLRCDHLIQVFETGETEIEGDRFLFGAMELPDDDVSQVLSNRKLDLDEARAMTSAAASALAYLHERSLRHGSVTAPNMFIVGETVKLSANTIATADEAGRRADLKQLGATITGALAKNDSKSAAQSLPHPFREIAMGCLAADQNGWTAQTILDVLDGRTVTPPVRAAAPARAAVADEYSEPDSHAARRRQFGAVAAAVAVVVLGVGAYKWMGSGSNEPPAQQQAAVKTSEPASLPVVVQPQQRPSPSKPAATPAPAPQRVRERSNQADRQAGGDWAVIAATYNSFSAAQKRADKIGAQSSRLQPHVYPAEGQGKRYYVVLGSGMTKERAEKLLRDARGQGAPRDLYVTKLKRG